ncbi:MAG TPA: hypothetical protein VFT22_36915 [Kofleriaceae bacterium]|nr:hypothetical protein [Kofleriaceae bacterium]
MSTARGMDLGTTSSVAAIAMLLGGPAPRPRGDLKIDARFGVLADGSRP